ncbi:MAG TPA: DegT/DnrJ/EryC1/StrS family aminotransferase [Terriglobales bacterium]|nr:DegT/DnrJ/EryC1/StrS family aminotransferase [Terriglobales bacterium]
MPSNPAPAAPLAEAPTKPLFPFLDLKAQEEPLREELLHAVAEVLDSKQYIMGPAAVRFEQHMAEYIGCHFALGCASGTDAVLLALRAVGVTAGDEVIVPSFTFVATAGMVAWLGAKPVFADIDIATFNLDVRSVTRCTTPRTKAIVPVHLFGLTADMDPLLALGRERGIAVVEDAAQAIGAKYHGRSAGTLAEIGSFSFYPTKNLGAGGDGGLITTKDPELAKRIKLLRNHGSPRRYEYDVVGTNSRLDSIQAAILDVKLKYLDRWAEGRRRNAARYNQLFGSAGLDEVVKTPIEPAGYSHIFNQYTVLAPRRDQLRQYLSERGIPTEIYYPFPLHLQPAFAGLGYLPGSLPVTEAVAGEVLSLPIYPELRDEQLQAVVRAIADFY